MADMKRLTQAQARRMAITATGLGLSRPTEPVEADHYRETLGRMGVIQLDSVNVLSRAHYLPFFSRLGLYPRHVLDQWLWTSQELFEYWGHERSLIPIEHRPSSSTGCSDHRGDGSSLSITTTPTMCRRFAGK